MNETDQELTEWWGLRRRPLVYIDLSITRKEVIGTGMLLGLGLLLVWAGLMVLLGTLKLGLIQNVWWEIGIPALLFLLPAAVGFIIPVKLLEGHDIKTWFLGSKIKGGLKGADRLILSLGLIGLALVIARALVGWTGASPVYPPGLLPPLMCLGLALVLTAGLLMMLKPLPFFSRGKTAPIPVWVDDDDFELVHTPEPDSTFVYPYPSEANKLGDVGVLVGQGVLPKLRQLNAEYDGALYQKDSYGKATAVVVCEEPPVNGVGVDEQERLARQLYALSSKAGWTRFQLAQRILKFVQVNIRYEYDEDSMQRIVGKAYPEYGRFPLETLVDEVGDCECTSILCASLLSYQGIPCALLPVTIHGNAFEDKSFHFAVGLRVDKGILGFGGVNAIDNLSLFKYQGKQYLYGETATDETSPDGFGVLPQSWANRIEIGKPIDIPVHGG